MPRINYNERSWAIDLISAINIWTSSRNIFIKRAGGENTINENGKSLFPDVLLFGDEGQGRIIQGWELKLPDTDINDDEFIKNARKKAELLSLNSFLLWNVTTAVLYKINEDGSLVKIKTWNGLSQIRTRDEVENSSDLIKAELHHILEDLNDFIQRGEVKSKSIIEVLNSAQVSELINRNTSTYKASISSAALSHTSVSQEIDLWWRYAKNDYPEEKDKFVVLARTSLVYLINKFLFAHILKSYQSEAARIDDIEENTSLNEGLNVFQAISERVDFWNIFQTQPYEKYITTDIWADIISFNNFLKSFNFQHIDRNLLHDLIEHIIYRNKRKFAGQFTTPNRLAKFLVEFAIKDRNGMAIDPCCGSGTIVREIFSEKKIGLSIDEALNTTWGSDKFSLPLQMTMLNMAIPEAMGKVIQVFKEDATKLSIGQRLTLRDPFNGEEIERVVPEFDSIASNLPFVRGEDIAVLNPNVFEINAFIEDKLGAGKSLDKRSDLYAYLPFYFWKILKDEGSLAFIISNSWLGTKWGERFFENLNAFYHVEAIVTSGKGKWFDNADVVTNIVVLRKKSEPGIDLEAKTKFVVTRKIIEQFTDDELREIIAMVSLRGDVSESDVTITTYSYEQILNFRSFGLNFNSLFTDNSWICSLRSVLINTSSLFDIRRGERRGWDSLFYPAVDNTIENRFLKPVLKTPRSISSLMARPDAKAFCCTESIEQLEREGCTGALNWIRNFEHQVNEKGKPLPEALSRPNTNWYTMTPEAMGEIVTNINFGDRLFFARFEESTFVNQRLVRFTRKNSDVDIELCHALLNSTLGLFYIEALGTGRGQGALDISKDRLEMDLFVINPALFNETQRNSILEKFEIIKNRDILSIKEELESSDRDDLDTAILEVIGFPDIKEKVKKSLLDLYHIRSCVNDQ